MIAAMGPGIRYILAKPAIPSAHKTINKNETTMKQGESMNASMPGATIKRTFTAAAAATMLALMATLLTAAAAHAADQPAVAAGQAQAGGDEKKICKKIEITGTRFPKTDCRTEREWDIVERRGRGNADEYMRKTSENAGIAPPAAVDGGGGRSMGVLTNGN